MDRTKDWLEQGKSDLKAANHLLDTNDFSWSCFLAQQTAEKALQALGENINIFLWGHDLVDLIEELEKKIKIPEKILDNSKTLNLYYIYKISRCVYKWASF
jgi:HEPN domain-containing protein